MGEKSRVGVLENAPPWWPHWKGQEFTDSDLLEIERYCEKILENIKKEKGMTPLERWKTTWELGMPDRPLVGNIQCNLTPANLLDGWSKSLKPGIDIHWYPKLCLKAHLAWVARFNVEFVSPYIFTYGDTEFGGRSKAKLVPYAAPAIIEPPIKTEADFETIHIPDLQRDGFYPAYLWMVRKIKEFMKKHGVADVLPMKADFCAEPASAGVVLRGMKQHMLDLRRNPEIVHRCAELDLKFKIEYGKAVLEAGADFMGCCSFGGFMGLELYKKLDIDKYNIALLKALPPNSFVYQIGFDQSQVLEYLCQTGSVSYGFIVSNETSIELARKVATKYKLHFTSMTDPMLVVTGPKEKIIEDVKNNLKVCAGTGYWFCASFTDYWSHPEYIDLVVRTAKEYGAELYKGLRK